MVTTTGKVLLRFFTPANLHKLLEENVLDKKGLAKLFEELAKASPEEYNRVVSDLTRLGFEVATRQGTSITLKDLVSPINKNKIYADFDAYKDKVEASNDARAVKNQKIFDKYDGLMSQLDKDLLSEGLKTNRSLAKIILAGSRGSPAQYRSTISTQGIVVGADGTPRMDIPIRSSFAEGLSLPEYLVTSFGTRSGEVVKKIGVADGGYACLQENTLVRMADFTTRELRDIKVGDWVLGADKERNAFPVRVTAKFDNGLRDVYSHAFRSLQSQTRTRVLNSTNEHNILFKNSTEKHKTWLAPVGTACPTNKDKIAGAYSAADVVSLPDYGVYDNKALFLGLMLGDGCWAKSVGTDIVFSCGDKALIAEVSPYFASLNYALKNSGKPKDYCYRLTAVQLEKKITSGGKNYTGHKIINWLKETKLLGTDSHTKFIPEECLGWDKKALSELVGGLFTTDGSFQYRYKDHAHFSIRITLCSESVIDRLLYILEQRFGIICNVSSGKSKHYEQSYGPTYTLTINNAEMVQRFIDNIPIYGAKSDAVRTFRVKLAEVANIYAPYRLISRTFLGNLQTYDIEVDHPDHLFVLANGLIVSNSKQFARALMNTKVEEHDCGTTRGIPYSVTDMDSVGCFFAKAAGGHNRNNEITAPILRELKEKGIHTIIVRSPMTCEASKHSHSGAVCQLCLGKREKGLPALDTYVGLVAGTALAEPLTNMAMKQRHSGGAATSLGGASGFKVINQLSNIPKTFIGKAPLAAEDGVVQAVAESPAGGYFINIGDHEYYIGVGQEPKVEKGDFVEEGQQLSTGLVDPSDAVRHLGIGAGRKYYMEAMKKTFDDGKLFVNRRNFELAARAAIDHVKITDADGLGDYMPDQVVSYSSLEKTYEPRPGAKELRPDRAHGKFLERPELHYTIGTKVSRAVIDQLNEHGVGSVLAHAQPPNFEPFMVRLLDVPEHTDDFMHVLNSTNLAKRFVNIVNKGGRSDLKGSSPVPGLAYGVGFGLKDE